MRMGREWGGEEGEGDEKVSGVRKVRDGGVKRAQQQSHNTYKTSLRGSTTVDYQLYYKQFKAITPASTPLGRRRGNSQPQDEA